MEPDPVAEAQPSETAQVDEHPEDAQYDVVVQTDKDMTNYGETFGVSEVVIRDGAFSGKMDKTVVGENAGAMAGTSAYGGVYDNKPTPEQLPEGKVVVDNGDGIYSVADATAEN